MESWQKEKSPLSEMADCVPLKEEEEEEEEKDAGRMLMRGVAGRGRTNTLPGLDVTQHT